MPPATRRALRAGAAVVVLLSATPATAATTDGARIQAWTANLRMMAHDGDETIWRKLVRRMAMRRLVPDVLALDEMCNADVGGAPGNDARQFVRVLEKRTGVGYSFRHSSTGPGPCWAADTMVVWRTRRFALSDVVRWHSLSDAAHDADDLCSAREGANSKQIGTALRDRLQDKGLALAAVHFPVPGTRRCINENVAVMDRKLDKLRAVRRLTIIGGDFNQVAQLERPTTGDELAAGTQVDPECWYRSLSLLTTNDRAACTGQRRGSPGRYRAHSDHYLDAVQAEHQGPSPGTTSAGICEEWTRARSYASAGNSCSDVSGPGDRPDGLMDRGRIDYIWARWALGDGRPRSFAPDQADALVERAAADKARPPRYSDHRAVHALISWCLPGERCRYAQTAAVAEP